MAKLSHPNLVNVYDFSAQGDTIFLIMELITGGTLRELLDERGPMPPHAAAAVMRGMLTGLAVAHNKGLIHRDIKPDNVLINSDHRVKLADFGLVRAAADATHSTDQIVGTVSYLSPEQVDGSLMTPASDVYAAGIVLFELLTGQTPFTGDTPLAHAYARLREDVPPPRHGCLGCLCFSTNSWPPPPPATAPIVSKTPRSSCALWKMSRMSLRFPPTRCRCRGTRRRTVPRRIRHRSVQFQRGPRPRSTRGLTAVNRGCATSGCFRRPAWRRTNPFMSPLTSMRPHSSQYEPAPAYEPAQVPHREAPARQPQPPAAPRRRTVSNRGGFAITLFVGLSIAATAAVLVGGWWFGSGMYGMFPPIFVTG